MKNLKFKKSRLNPNLTDNQNKKLFRSMNIALIIGGLSLISTFLYLIANLDKADKIVTNWVYDKIHVDKIIIWN